MESKIIKVKTDGDIQRDAHVVSGFDIDGSKYIIYYIDRDDNEHDNIFASKLIMNTDNTFNMINIDNADEKTRIANIVKQIVKGAVDDNEHDTIEGDTVTLADGKVAKMFPVIINVEQRIDINKTYITTVKKNVTEVTRKYFDIKPVGLQKVEGPSIFNDDLPVINQISEPVKDDSIMNKVITAPVPEMPTVSVDEPKPVEENNETLSIDEQAKMVVPDLFNVENKVVDNTPTVSDSIPNLLEPTPTANTDLVNNNTSEVISTPVNNVVVNNTLAVDNTNVVNDVSAPVDAKLNDAITGLVDNQSVNNNIKEVVPAPVDNVVVNNTPVVDNTNVVNETPAPVAEPVINSIPNLLEPTEVKSEPIKPVELNTNQNDFISPSVVTATNIVAGPENVPTNNMLVFDASNETNLNNAIDKRTDSIPVADINAIKDFGVDDSVNKEQGIKPMVQPEQNNNPPVLTKSAGFANSKLFIFIAIGFFLASCVFLGYEAFNYFQLIK